MFTMKNTVKRICYQCHHSFRVLRFIPHHRPAKFCSYQCKYLGQRGIIRTLWKKTPILCQKCHQSFLRKSSPEQRFCSGSCAAKTRTGSRHPSWKGGLKKRKDGYLAVRIPPSKYILQHRLFMERNLGRKLLSSEHVHHLNGVKDDNRIDNLVLLTHNEHSRLTGFERRTAWSRAGHLRCLHCQTTSKRHCANGLCDACYQKSRR